MTNTIRLIVKPASQVRTVVRGIGVAGNVVKVEDMLSLFSELVTINTSGVPRANAYPETDGNGSFVWSSAQYFLGLDSNVPLTLDSGVILIT